MYLQYVVHVMYVCEASCVQMVTMFLKRLINCFFCVHLYYYTHVCISTWYIHGTYMIIQHVPVYCTAGRVFMLKGI